MERIDYHDADRLWEISQELVDVATKCNLARQKAAHAKWTLDIILASKMSQLRNIKTNLGYETARIMLLESNEPEVLESYKDEERYTAEYKGLEGVAEALKTQISLGQSLIKNTPK
jgi:hypothetical protein